MRRGVAASSKSAALWLAGVLAASSAGAASLYDEALSGDLSGDSNAPTVLAFSAGSNVVRGTVQGLGSNDDDFFTFALASGLRLDAIVLQSHAPSATSTFLGLDSGATFANLANAAMLGHVLFDAGDVLTDLLPAMASSNGSFSPPLGAGAYSAWLDEGGTLESYSLDFQVSAVPEPTSAALLGLGLGSLALGRRRAA